MKKIILITAGFFASFVVGFSVNRFFSQRTTSQNKKTIKTEKQAYMKLGVFSISLSVKDLKTSKEFYQKLGFSVLAGSREQGAKLPYTKNENAIIGLFQGMFQGNILTFNPGWDENADSLENYDDIRKIQTHLKNSGLTLTSEADDTTVGPSSLSLTDPDGNVILLDQHR